MPKHCCCSYCFRDRFIIVTERRPVVLPRPQTSKSKYLGRQCLPVPLIKSAYANARTFPGFTALDRKSFARERELHQHNCIRSVTRSADYHEVYSPLRRYKLIGLRTCQVY